MSLIGNVDTPASYVADYMQACVGMFGIPVGGFVSDIETFGASNGYDVESLYAAMLNSTIGRSIYAPGISNESFATKLVDKVGGGLLSDADKAAAIDEVQALLDGGLSQAATAMAVVEFVAGLETSDETYGAVAQQFANRIEIANYYTFSSTNPSSTLSTLTAILSSVDNETDVSDPEAVLEENTDPGVSTGQTFTLTSAIDNIIGTSGNDTIIGDSGTLSAADQINGGTGEDTFKLVIDSTNAETVTFTNGEILLVTATAAGDADVTNSKSLTKVGFVNNSAAGAIKNIANVVDVSIAGGATGNDNVLTFVDSVVTGSSDTVNVSLESAKMKDLQLIGATTGTAGFETVNITATGTGTAGNTITTLKSGSTNIATKVTFAGAGDVTVTNALTATTTIDASASTGKIKVAADTSKNVTFTGGSGDDTIYMLTGFDANDTLNGGAGTDTVGISDATDLTATTGAKITNFEVLDIVGSGVTNAYDMDYLSGITKITASGALGANTTINNMAATTNVELTADIGSYSLTLNKKGANLSASDVMTLTVSNAASLSLHTSSAIDVNDIETLTLVATTTSSGSITHTIDDLTANETTKLVVNADSTAKLTVSTLTATGLVELDASAATKDVSITMAAAIVGGANGASFTLGKGNDTLDLKAVTDFATATHNTTTTATVQLKGGAGADTFKIDAITTGEVFVFKYDAGDSVSDSTAANGISTSKTDTITDFITSTAYSATAGMKFTLDTLESATAVSELNNSTGVVFGTTAVTNAYDFLVYHNGASSTWFVYQDTDGDKIIESGEFAVKLVGATTDFAISEFAVASGNLVYTSA